MDRILGISPLHNRALEERFVALLKGLPVLPIKNWKKTLEIYFELLNTNGSDIKDKELEKILRIWREKERLKKSSKTGLTMPVIKTHRITTLFYLKNFPQTCINQLHPYLRYVY